MSAPKPQSRLDAAAVLRGILNDYQLEIAGPDVDRGIAAVRSLEEQLQTAERQRDLAQREAEMYKADRDEYDALLGRKMTERDGLLEQLETAQNALSAIYWRGGLSEEVEQIIASVLTPEQRVAWAKTTSNLGVLDGTRSTRNDVGDSNPASEPEER